MATMRDKWANNHHNEEKPTSPDRKLEAAQKAEVPAENATVMPVEEPKKKRRRDRQRVAERRLQEPKKVNGGPQEKLAVDRRGTTHHVKVARKTPTDRKMSRRATVARRKREIVKSYLLLEKHHQRRELVTSRTRTTHRTKVARQMENAIGKIHAKDNVVRGTWKGWTPRWRHLICQEGTKETKNRDFADKLQLGSKWTPWRGRPPPKRKKGNSPCGRNWW
jgi:hypothetical protein